MKKAKAFWKGIVPLVMFFRFAVAQWDARGKITIWNSLQVLEHLVGTCQYNAGADPRTFRVWAFRAGGNQDRSERAAPGN